MQILTVIAVTTIAAVMCIEFVWKIIHEIRCYCHMKKFKREADDEDRKNSLIEKRLDRFEKKLTKQVDKKINEKIDTLGEKIEGLSDCLDFNFRKHDKKTSSDMDNEPCDCKSCNDNDADYDEDDNYSETNGTVVMDDVIGAYFKD